MQETAGTHLSASVSSGILPDSICTYKKSGDIYVCILTNYAIIHVYTYTMHICTYICICTYCMYMHVFACIFQSSYRYTCIKIHIRAYVHICIYEHTYRYVHRYIYEYTNIRAYIHLHLYIHIRAYVRKSRDTH
jgi:hypothetical protein